MPPPLVDQQHPRQRLVIHQQVGQGVLAEHRLERLHRFAQDAAQAASLDDAAGVGPGVEALGHQRIAFGGPRAYNAVKAAVINYVSNLATQLAPKNIRANTVSPGTIYFDDGVWGARKRDMPAIYEAALAQNPMGRMGTPAEVANAVVFVASPAASFVTGANLVVDGGFTRRVQY